MTRLRPSTRVPITLRRVPCFVCAALLGLGACFGQEPPKVEPTPPQDPVADMLKAIKDAGLVVDTAAKTIVVPAVMGRPADPIEFVLVHRRGKGHETLFVTDVKASILNAAMLLIGFQPGENAKSVERVKKRGSSLSRASSIASTGTGMPICTSFRPILNAPSVATR